MARLKRPSEALVILREVSPYRKQENMVAARACVDRIAALERSEEEKGDQLTDEFKHFLVGCLRRLQKLKASREELLQCLESMPELANDAAIRDVLGHH